MSEAPTNMTAAVGAKQVADPHAEPQYQETGLQLTLLISYLVLVTIWLFRQLIGYAGDDAHKNESADHAHDNHSNHVTVEMKEPNGEIPSTRGDHRSGSKEFTTREFDQLKIDAEDNEDAQRVAVDHKSPQEVGPPRPALEAVTFDRFLSSLVLFGAIMIYFYLCDYRKLFEQGERTYSRDQFMFLVFIFFLVSCCFTMKTNSDKILNRDQTEEWKGWMQVMFVWYHYFKAKEWYNWIRVYIACYVWMTGFGNFSFFWIRNDYSLWRFLKMMFRLNFLVIFVAMTTNNEYMLYYICAMHTYWFLSVYAFMRVLQSWNRTRKLMALKFLAYAAFNSVVFEIPGLAYYIFRPFQFILGLHDSSEDVLHEWIFRARLDHWACFFGMLCAYNYPHFEALMHYLDSKSISRNEEIKKLCIRGVMGGAGMVLGFVWYFYFMTRDKYEYNAVHPYTSAIPILVYIVLRNIHPYIRSYHVNLFAWLGKITLETYLSQLHIYLLSNARTLLVFIHGYPLLNFSLTTIMYLLTSHALFKVTNDCSTYFIPRDHKRLLLNLLCLLLLFGVSATIAFPLSM
ncbi:Protein REDUCED WALL ACETYLATION 2 [Bulinus truncatus]|nr:Protein REDUCED WALL ACETYLATION 2 [Bulinus truncatus]